MVADDARSSPRARAARGARTSATDRPCRTVRSPRRPAPGGSSGRLRPLRGRPRAPTRAARPVGARSRRGAFPRRRPNGRASRAPPAAPRAACPEVRAGASSGATNGGRPGANSRVEDVLGPERGRRVRVAALHLAQLADGTRLVPGGQEREAEVESRDAARRVLRDELLQSPLGPVRPGGDGGADGRLDRVGVLGEDLLEARGRLGAAALVVQPLGCAQRPGLGVVAEKQPQLEGRCRALGGRRRGRFGALPVLGLEQGDADDDRGRGRRRDADENACPSSGRHRPNVALGPCERPYVGRYTH